MAEQPNTAPLPSPLRLWLPTWDIRPDGPNELLGEHWSRRQRRAKKAWGHVLAAIAPLRRRKVPGRVALTVTRHMRPRQRPLDYDNAIAACKPLIDAFVKHRVIGGDSLEHVASVTPRFVRAKVEGDEIEDGTEILIEPVPPA